MPVPVDSVLPTLDDVRTHLNITTTADDAELQGFLDAAVELVEQYVGALDTVSVTETHRYAMSPIVLRRTPVVSVESVTISGTAVTGTELDTTTGLLYGSWSGDVVVSYTAGRASLPAPVRMAILEVVRDMWNGTQRGGGTQPRFPGSAAEDMTFSQGRPVLPPHAAGLLEPYMLGPAVA